MNNLKLCKEIKKAICLNWEEFDDLLSSILKELLEKEVRIDFEQTDDTLVTYILNTDLSKSDTEIISNFLTDEFGQHYDIKIEDKCPKIVLTEPVVKNLASINLPFDVDFIVTNEKNIYFMGNTPKCPEGGDITNDCADCIYNGDFRFDYDTEECVRRK